jgi:hypothetical protein
MKHTPTPWIANDQHSGNWNEWRIESEHEHGIVNDGWIIASFKGSDDEANTKFAVHAVNSHDALIGFIKLIADFNNISTNMPQRVKALDKFVAKAVILLAKIKVVNPCLK